MSCATSPYPNIDLPFHRPVYCFPGAVASLSSGVIVHRTMRGLGVHDGLQVPKAPSGHARAVLERKGEILDIAPTVRQR